MQIYVYFIFASKRYNVRQSVLTWKLEEEWILKYNMKEAILSFQLTGTETGLYRGGGHKFFLYQINVY